MKAKIGSKVIVAVLSMGLFLTAAVWAQTNQSISSSHHEEIPATEAKNHIGEIATVYGKLYRVWFDTGRYVDDRGNAARYVTPIILDVGGYDTNRLISVVLLDGNNPSFLRLKEFEGEEISVRGKIGTNRTSGLPEMNIRSANWISIVWQPPEGDEIKKVSGTTPKTFSFDEAQKPDSAQAKSQAKGDLLDQIAAEQGATNKPRLTFTEADFADGGTNALDSPKPWEKYQKPAAPKTNKIPSWWVACFANYNRNMTNTIITLAGKTYYNAEVTRFEPDGLTIAYLIGSSGLGEIKISFENLPAAYRVAYGYSAQKALDYENGLEQAALEVQVKAQIQEQIKAQKAAHIARLNYEMAKEQYDNDLKLEALGAQQRAAAAQEQLAFIASQKQMQDAINDQNKLFEMQEQSYQQRKIANSLDDLDWQYRLNSIYNH